MYICKVNAIKPNFIYRRKHTLSDKLPQEYMPCVASEAGDCLFCSASIALFVSESHYMDLRFAAVHHAVNEHILKMVSVALKCIHELFRCKPLAQSRNIYQRRCTTIFGHYTHQVTPYYGTTEDILRYNLVAEIMATA